MSEHSTCDTIACSSHQGTCFVATNYNPNTGTEYAKRNKCSVIGLAVTELILGICLIGIGIILIPVTGDHYKWANVGTNIWGGSLIIFFSSFCFAQACCPSRCTIGANLGVSVVGIFVSLALMGLEIISTVFCWYLPALLALHSTAATFYLILFILYIISSCRSGTALGYCKGCCCRDHGLQEIVRVNVPCQSRAITLSNGQAVLLQGYPQNVPLPSYAENPPPYRETTLTRMPGQITVPETGSNDSPYNNDIPPKI